MPVNCAYFDGELCVLFARLLLGTYRSGARCLSRCNDCSCFANVLSSCVNQYRQKKKKAHNRYSCLYSFMPTCWYTKTYLRFFDGMVFDHLHFRVPYFICHGSRSGSSGIRRKSCISFGFHHLGCFASRKEFIHFIHEIDDG